MSVRRIFSERAMLAILRMEDMITELLDYARLGTDVPLKQEVVYLPVIVENVKSLLEDLANHRRLTITLKYCRSTGTD